MAEWITPIYDRTPADVSKAKLQVKKWIEAIACGKSVVVEDLKGYLNVSDLNRIENDMAFLAVQLGIALKTKTRWLISDLPTQADLNRIINNLKILMSLLFRINKPLPTTISDYSDLNTIEYYLNESYEYLLHLKAAKLVHYDNSLLKSMDSQILYDLYLY